MSTLLCLKPALSFNTEMHRFPKKVDPRRAVTIRDEPYPGNWNSQGFACALPIVLNQQRGFEGFDFNERRFDRHIEYSNMKDDMKYDNPRMNSRDIVESIDNMLKRRFTNVSQHEKIS